MTLGRCPLSISYSRGTPPARRGARAHAPVDVPNENLLSQPTLSLSPPDTALSAGNTYHGEPSSTETGIEERDGTNSPTLARTRARPHQKGESSNGLIQSQKVHDRSQDERVCTLHTPILVYEDHEVG